jgi:hypothetical protein
VKGAGLALVAVALACGCRTYDTIYTSDAGGTCQPPNLTCNGLCVDPSGDRGNCGACGIVCQTNQLCSGGNCIACPKAGTVACGASGAAFCADLSSDNGNCGACGNVCAHGTACQGGACVCPLTTCGADCVDTTSDVSHCGGCNTTCPAPAANEVALCTKGQCSVTCIAPFADCDGAGTNGCETNVLTSGADCGACGRVCLGAQACTAGTCPVTTYIVGGQLGGLAVDASWVYFADQSSTGAIFEAPLGGGTPQSVYADNQATVLAVDATNLVWLHLNDQIDSRPLSGGTPTILASPAGVLDIALDGGWVYYGTSGGVLARVPEDGSASPVTMESGKAPASLAVDGTDVYFAASSGDVLSVPVGAQNVTASPFASNASAVAVATDATTVYWATANGLVYGQAKNASTSTLLGSAASIATNLVTDGVSLYFGTTTGEIERLAVSGGTPLTVATQQSSTLKFVAVDATSVYWVSSSWVRSTTK